MKQSILHVSLLVRDYDEAIAFYRDKLKFELVEDTPLPAENAEGKTSDISQIKRWVVMVPPGGSTMSLVLAKAHTSEEIRQIGTQAGGRVFLFLCTDDFQRDYQSMQADGIEFIRAPQTLEYGTVAVFSDLYGNLWDLLEPAKGHAMYSRLG